MEKKRVPTPVLYVFTSIFCLLIICSSQVASAQMFSVGNERPEDRPPPQRNAYIGVGPAEFEFHGNEQNVLNSNRFDFDSQIVKLRYETLNLNFFINFSNSLTGADSVNYFNFGLEFVSSIQIADTEDFQFGVPIQFRGDFTNVNNQNVQRGQGQFQQNNLQIGTGLMFEYRLTRAIRFGANAIPNAGITFSAGNTFFGTTYGVISDSRLYFDRIIGQLGLSFGYQFKFKRFNIDTDLFDYDLRSNIFSIGLTF